MSVFLALLLITLFSNITFFLILLPIVLMMAAYTTYRFVNLHKAIYKFLSGFGRQLNNSTVKGMLEMPMPVMATSASQEIVWYNDSFRDTVLLCEDIYGAFLHQITGDITLEQIQEQQGILVSYQGKHYHVYVIHLDQEETSYLFYFVDVTQIEQTSQNYYKQRPVVMTILIDSYEEVVKNIRESERTQILSEMNRLLEQYIGEANGFIQRLQRDRYLAVIEKQYFDHMIEQRFPILDESKNIITSERVPVTLSIGVGYQADSLEKNEQESRQGLEMALGRGGDQVAVKTQDGFQFYGGVSKGIEKRTKVKSRILASAMRELIENSDNVLIMGHQFADLDAIGSAIGLARACICLRKSVNIVTNRNRCLATMLIDYYEKFEGEGLFIQPVDALNIVRRNTLLFVVDTHSPHFVESEDVYRACKNVVVIDHHRKMVDYIDNALIFFHEPYTSSTSEMVTELVQYMGDECILNHYHAEALMSGIMLDTKDFVMKTGVRTFEAAAFLKKMGADTIEVKHLFAGSMDSYKNKTKLVANAEVYKRTAIVCSEIVSDDIRIIAPQAADELLNIEGVDASFVLFEQNDAINVNARSRGLMNVQLIMEKLGGGGHQTMAGAQVPRASMSGVKALLMKSIDDYFK